MTEEWRDIPNWEGYYQVSNQGRARSVERTVVTNGRGVRTFPGRMLQPTLGQRTDRYSIALFRGGSNSGTRRDVHTLVAAAFLGPRPDGLFVCHNSPDHHDNRVENLRYDTPSQNSLDMLRHGTNFSANKTHCPKNHPYSGDNLVLRRDRHGEMRWRACRECQRARVIGCRSKL